MFSTELNPQAANNYNYCIAKKYIDAFLTYRHGHATPRPPLSAALMRPPA